MKDALLSLGRQRVKIRPGYRVSEGLYPRTDSWE